VYLSHNTDRASRSSRFERGGGGGRRFLGPMNFPRMIPRICCARPRNSLGRFTGFVVPQVREARAVVYKQRLLWWCVHGTLPGIILGRGNSLPICLWNQLPVTSSTCSPAERNGRRPSGLRGPRENPPFFPRDSPRPTNESADFQFALRTRSLPFCLLQRVK